MNTINTSQLEARNQKIGLRVSIVAHLALLFLAFYFLLPNDPNKNIDTQYSVTIDFSEFKESSLSKYAHADPGAKRPKSVEIKKVKPAPVKPVEVKTPPKQMPKTTPVIVPKPTEPIVSEVLEEESIIEAIEEDIKIEEPELEDIVEPEPIPEPVIEEVVEVEDPVEEVLPTEAPSQTNLPSENGSDVAANDSGTADTAPSVFDGEDEGTGKGSEGDGAGMDGDSGNDGDSGVGTGGAGTGAYDGSGDGIFGRKVIYRDKKALMEVINKSGKIVMKMCINPSGEVTYVEIDEESTTIRDRKVLNKALKAIRNYKFEPKPNGPSEECGKMTISQDLSSINKFN